MLINCFFLTRELSSLRRHLCRQGDPRTIKNSGYGASKLLADDLQVLTGVLLAVLRSKGFPFKAGYRFPAHHFPLLRTSYSAQHAFKKSYITFRGRLEQKLFENVTLCCSEARTYKAQLCNSCQGYTKS